MKILKTLIAVLFLTVFVSCGSDDDTPFLLTNANIAGTYEMTSFNEVKKETATSSSGATVDISTTTSVGEILNVDLTISANGSYSASESYSVDITEEVSGQSDVVSDDIILVDTTGSYQINTTDNVITFTPTSGTFVNGTFDITSFSENTLRISQETTTQSGSNTITTETKITFTRK